jgi:hypothetical protein
MVIGESKKNKTNSVAVIAGRRARFSFTETSEEKEDKSRGD